MESIHVFMVLSIPIIYISWKSLWKPLSHGFYRFFSWECILWLVTQNFRYWFDQPFSVLQIISWILLLLSIYLVLAGFLKMQAVGKAQSTRQEDHLFQFEKTTKLIDTGIFKRIRHPLYSSLLFLTWGIFLKNVTSPLFIVAMLSSVCLFVTAYMDEKECIAYFGEEYKEYMKRSKRFVPWLI